MAGDLKDEIHPTGFGKAFKKQMLPKSLFSLSAWVDYVGEWGISRALFLWILYLGLLFVCALSVPDFATFALGWFFGTAPIWGPIVLLSAANSTWIWYVHSQFLSHVHPVLLEVKIPREITKSPRAMEMVFNQLWTTSGEVTFITRFWKGSVRTFYSFELCSFGGEIHFYVWCWKKYRRVLETALYGQFPDIEIFEVEDYAMNFVFDPKKHMAFVGDYRKVSSSTDYPNVFPLRTYIDFELDKDPKEEFKIDPIASVFETLSNLKPTEQVWIQLIIRSLKQDGELLTYKNKWAYQVRYEIDNLRRQAALKPGERLDEDKPPQGFPYPTWRQTERIKSMERALTKQPFEVGARHIYISDPDHFDGTIFTAVRWLWKNFHYLDPTGESMFVSKGWHNDFDYPWQDWKGIRWNLLIRRGLDAYRRRSFFYEPWKSTDKSNVMSPEELATLWHFPSSSIKAPGLRRSLSKKAEPPANLPI
ncbi:hypothetical protein EBR66_04405 [bacterium]|nr:hypothetical protein [bacterium]